MENLKALVYGGNLNPYQKALAQREFKDLIERLELLKTEEPFCECDCPSVRSVAEDFKFQICETCGRTVNVP